MFVIPSKEAAATKSGPLVPPKCYRVLVTKVNNAPSKSSGLPMSTLSCQILSPDSVTNPNGTVSQTAGIEGDLRFVFSDKSFEKIVQKIRLLGITFTDAHATFEDAIVAIQTALSEQAPTLTFEMVIESKREVTKDLAGQTMRDSQGNEILGMERAEFAWFNIQGIPLPITSPALAGITRPSF